MSTSNLRGDSLHLEDAVFDGEDFSGLRLTQFTATACVFRRCRFERCHLDQACFGGGTSPSEYINCTFDGSRITAIAPGVARFVGCSFRNCDIREFFGVAVEFVDCTFSGRIKRALFHGTVPAYEGAQIGRATNEFHGNDFSGAKLLDVAFRGGIDLEKQRLPEGRGYAYIRRGEEAVERARRKVIQWQDLELRRTALAILKVFESNIERGQEQLFVALESLPKDQREAAERLLPELSEQVEGP